MNNQQKLEALQKEANQAYLNSISLTTIFSTDPKVQTRTSEAKRLLVLNKKIKSLEAYIRYDEIEKKLPDFRKMTDEEIYAFIDNSPCMHYCPVNTTGDFYEVTYDDGSLVLAHNYYSEEGWVAISHGVVITPRIGEYLKTRICA